MGSKVILLISKHVVLSALALVWFLNAVLSSMSGFCSTSLIFPNSCLVQWFSDWETNRGPLVDYRGPWQ